MVIESVIAFCFQIYVLLSRFRNITRTFVHELQCFYQIVGLLPHIIKLFFVREKNKICIQNFKFTLAT